jgi:hypothetical protein
LKILAEKYRQRNPFRTAINDEIRRRKKRYLFFSKWDFFLYNYTFKISIKYLVEICLLKNVKLIKIKLDIPVENEKYRNYSIIIEFTVW